MEATRLSVSDIIATIISQVVAASSDEARLVYETHTAGLINTVTDELRTVDLCPEDWISGVKQSMEEYLKLDEETARHFIETIRACCGLKEVFKNVDPTESMSSESERSDESSTTATGAREQHTISAKDLDGLVVKTAALGEQLAALGDQLTAGLKHTNEQKAELTKAREQLTTVALPGKHTSVIDDIVNAILDPRADSVVPATRAAKQHGQQHTKTGSHMLICDSDVFTNPIVRQLENKMIFSFFTDEEQKLLIFAMLCYKSGAPAIDYARFAQAANFDSIEVAKASWESITRTAAILNKTMGVDTWEQRSKYPFFTKEWDKLIVVAMHCLEGNAPEIDILKFRIVAKFDTLAMANRAWLKVSVKLAHLARGRYIDLTVHEHAMGGV